MQCGEFALVVHNDFKLASIMCTEYICRVETAISSQTAISKQGNGVQLKYFSTDVNNCGTIQRTNHRAMEHNLIKKFTYFGPEFVSGCFSGCCGHNSGTKVDRFFGEITLDSPMVAFNGTTIVDIG